MKALVWTNPREFELQDVQKPTAGAGEVVLQVRYAGICGSDLSGYLGENSLRKPPLIMGHEFTGDVVETGEGVSEFQVGDLLVVNPLITCGHCRMCKRGDQQNCMNRTIIGIHHPGAFAEYVKVPASACFHVQDALAGALVEPLACGIRAAERANVTLGDKVVVFGAGIIGLFSLQAASLRGASQRILVDTNDERLEKGKLFGATHTLNPKHVDVIESVQEITGGSAQKVIDAVGLPLTRQQGIAMVERGGRVVFIGLHEDETVIPGNDIVRREIELVGSFSYSDRNFAEGLSLIERKGLTPDDTWLDIRPLDQGKLSFDEQIFGSAKYPKIILSV
jgi:threonine dehydrogenase-like Zn-dependent dehydrogenase